MLIEVGGDAGLVDCASGGLDREGLLLVPIYTLPSQTPYTRYGQWIFLGMAVLNLVFTAAWTYVSSRRG